MVLSVETALELLLLVLAHPLRITTVMNQKPKALVEYLDVDGHVNPDRKQVRALRLTDRDGVWYYAGSADWGRGITLDGCKSDYEYLTPAPSEGCSYRDRSRGRPVELLGQSRWSLVTEEDWRRLSRALQAQGEYWPHASALGLSTRGVVWLRDQPRTVLAHFGGRLRSARADETADRVFCARASVAKRFSIRRLGDWPQGVEISVATPSGTLLQTHCDRRVDLADVVMEYGARRRRQVRLGIRFPLRERRWTEELIDACAARIRYDFEYDGYQLKVEVIDGMIGRLLSEWTLFDLRIRQ